MRDYIILNNKNSNEIKGLLIQNLPPITKPRIRAEIEEIDGKDGDNVTPLGYGAYDKVFSIGLYGDFDINEVIKYFDSEGIVVFSNEPNKYYNYKILEQIDFEKLIRFRTADVMMHVQPFKYSTTEGKETEEMENKTASGSEIDLPDTNNEKLQMEKSKGNTYQETTSDIPSPQYPSEVKVVKGNNVVSVSGKNLVDYLDVKGIGSRDGTNNITLDSSSIDGDLLTITKTYQQGGGILKFNNISLPKIEQGEIVTISFIPNKTIRGVVGISNYNGGGTNNITTYASFVENSMFEISLEALSTYDKLGIFIQGLNQSIGIKNLLVERDSTATPYVPYSKTDYPINLYDRGENLAIPLPEFEDEFDGLSINMTETDITINGTYTGNFSANYGVKTITLEKGNYTLNGCPKTPNNSYYLRLVNSNDTTEEYKDFGEGVNFTIDSSKTFDIEIVILPSSTFNNVVFTPNVFITTLIELCKIGDCQDYLYKNNEKWFKHKEIGKVVFDGSESWEFSSKSNIPTPRSVILLSSYIDFQSLIYYSNYFTNDDENTSNRLRFYVQQSNYRKDIYLSLDNEIVGISSDDSNATRLEKIKTWLSTHNTIVYYVLATPTEEEITDTSLIAQLEALDNIYNQKGTTYIKTNPEGNNMPLDLDVSYIESRPITITNSGNIYSKPIFTIYGEGNIGVYLNDIQLFDINLGSEEQITIDVAEMQAYNKETKALKNRLVTGNYDKFLLKIGENKISFSGIVKKFEIENYSRWI